MQADDLTYAPELPGRWTEGPTPANVTLGQGTLVTGELAFKRFHSTRPEALRLGIGCTMDQVHFDLGVDGRAVIGDHCFFSNVVLLAEAEVRIGDRVAMGWNATIADTDFHPLDPELRRLDAIACSPLANGAARPKIEAAPIIIEDDVWIGPNACIMKGVTIGCGAWIDPGAMVTRDVPAGVRVQGNPARIVGAAE